MSKVQSKELTIFYRAYKKWLDEGAITAKPFFRSCGLCNSIEDIMIKPSKVENELRSQFKKSGLNLDYPFGELNYEKCAQNNEQHLDPLRIKWVEDHLKPEFTGEAE